MKKKKKLARKYHTFCPLTLAIRKLLSQLLRERSLLFINTFVDSKRFEVGDQKNERQNDEKICSNKHIHGSIPS